MMLVEHDVEAELVGELPLIVVAMKQIGGDVRIAFAVGEGDAQRSGMLVPRRVIGLFAELVELAWRALPSFRVACGEARNA